METSQAKERRRGGESVARALTHLVSVSHRHVISAGIRVEDGVITIVIRI